MGPSLEENPGMVLPTTDPPRSFTALGITAREPRTFFYWDVGLHLTPFPAPWECVCGPRKYIQRLLPHWALFVCTNNRKSLRHYAVTSTFRAR